MGLKRMFLSIFSDHSRRETQVSPTTPSLQGNPGCPAPHPIGFEGSPARKCGDEIFQLVFLHLCILFIENIHHNICGEIMFFFKKKQQLYNNLIKSHGIGY